MKISRSLSVFLLLMLAASTVHADAKIKTPVKSPASPASIAGPNTEGALAQRKAQQEKVISENTTDFNKDGVVDENDRQMMRDFFTRLDKDGFEPPDTNHDGKVDENEKKVMREKMAARSKKWLTDADTNHDGIIQPEEQKAAMAKWAASKESK